MIYPSELIPATTTAVTTVVTSVSRGGSSYGGDDGKVAIPSLPRYTYTGLLSYIQIINKTFQAGLLMDVVAQNGYLALPFHRVYFTDATVHTENLLINRGQ